MRERERERERGGDTYYYAVGERGLGVMNLILGFFFLFCFHSSNGM